MENSKNEKHFKNTIALGLDKKLPWLRLASILDEMTPTLEETKLLVKVLLQELQAMQMILDQRPIEVQVPRVQIQRIHVSNCETESRTNHDHTKEVEIENENVFETQDNESPKSDDGIEETAGDGINFELDSSSDDDDEDDINSDYEESYNGTTLSIEEDETQIKEKNIDDTNELTENTETNPDDQEPYEGKIFSIELNEGTETQIKEENLDEKNELTDSNDIIVNPEKLHAAPDTNEAIDENVPEMSADHIKAESLKSNEITINMDAKVSAEELIPHGNLTTRFQCDRCKSKFTTHQKLSKHQSRDCLSCMKCEKSFESRKRLQIHKSKDCDDAKKYECDICLKKYKDKHILTEHKTEVHGRPFKCDHCKKSYNTQLKLSLHQKSSKKCNVKNLKCDSCDKSFTNQSQLQWHKSRICNVNKTYQCDLCPKKYVKSGTLTEHKRDIHGIISFQGLKCEHCERTFKNEIHLTNHTNMIHLKIKKYPCHQCESAFITEPKLRTHIQIVHDKTGKKSICDQCGKRFRCDSDMKNHIGIVHDKNTCSICFKVVENVPEHKEKFHEKVPCNQCGLTFNRSYLNTHIKSVHDNIRNYKCSYCEKSFFAGNDRRKHIAAVHMKEKPYQCDICFKRFISNFVEEHKRQVHEKIRYPCSHCDSKFACKKYLQRHIDKEHNGIEEKPYQCDICFKTFPNNFVPEHKRQVHEKVRYPCDHCDSTFVKKQYLKEHIKKTHNVSAENYI